MRNYESLEDRFNMDKYGNFKNSEDVKTAVSDGALSELSNGRLWDKSTGAEYTRNGEHVS